MRGFYSEKPFDFNRTNRGSCWYMNSALEEVYVLCSVFEWGTIYGSILLEFLNKKFYIQKNCWFYYYCILKKGWLCVYCLVMCVLFGSICYGF
jgi:hypothetical protein